MTRPDDVVFLNATLVDGTGSPPRVADVAVRGDRVCFIGDYRGTALRMIDARNQLLIPGFVDIHSHSDYSLLADPLAHSKVMQGVTTEVGGNCGYHAAPIFGSIADERQTEYARTLRLHAGWRSFAEYAEALEQARPAVNYAQQIGYNTLRSAVTADHARALSQKERGQLKDLVCAEFERGAVGLSYGLAYSPACFSSASELEDVAEVAAEFDKVITFHLRSEDRLLIESLEEALAIGLKSGARTHVGHLKTFRRPNWWKLDRALEVLDAARRKGLRLTVDRYPHLAMNTQLKFALPVWVLEGGAEAMKARLRDPDDRRRIVDELGQMHSDEAHEVLVSLVSRPENRAYEGRFLDDIAAGENPWACLCRLLADEGDSAFATFFGMNRDNLDRILLLDNAMVASDASVQAIHLQAGGGRPHPRCFDTFPFFLAEWVFARKTMPIELAVRKVTSLPAETAQLANRGRVQEGWCADLALLDPTELKADVSYDEPTRFPDGVVTVMVNGVIVVNNGKHLGARPGRLLKMPGKAA